MTEGAGVAKLDGFVVVSELTGAFSIRVSVLLSVELACFRQIQPSETSPTVTIPSRSI